MVAVVCLSPSLKAGCWQLCYDDEHTKYDTTTV